MCQNKLLGVVGGALGRYTSLIFQKLFSGKSVFLINQFTFWKFSQLCFSFWYANIDIPNDAAWGGWWGFGTEHIADFSDFFLKSHYFMYDISEIHFWLFRTKFLQYYKLYFCHINYQHSQLVLTPGTSLGNWALPLKSFNIAALGQHTVHRDTLPGT